MCLVYSFTVNVGQEDLDIRRTTRTGSVDVAVGAVWEKVAITTYMPSLVCEYP